MALNPLLAALALLIGAAPTPGAAPAAIRFEITNAPLPDAAKAITETLDRKVVLDLLPSSPARKRTVTLTMTSEEPEEILTTVACAYGVRWLPRSKPGEVSFVEKSDYRGTAVGMRQALADAVPPEYRELVRPYASHPLIAEEAPLKNLTSEERTALARFTSNGAVPVRTLPPALARPLLLYLNAYAYSRLGESADASVQDIQANNLGAFFWLGVGTPGGSPQFQFQVRGMNITCGPE